MPQYFYLQASHRGGGVNAAYLEFFSLKIKTNVVLLSFTKIVLLQSVPLNMGIIRLESRFRLHMAKCGHI